jgi:ABC-type lipoprotein release transport system permease subunit
MQHLSKEMLEKHRERSRQELIEHQLREERFRKEQEKRARKKRIILIASGGVALVIIALIVNSALSPGKYDEFAKCLTEKGAVMYGEDWCRYTNAQKAMFGKSFKYIKYVQKPDIKVRPTWVINGKTYETVQSFERLSALTGCKI